MNTKSFAIGFAAMDSIIAGVSATKRGIVHAAEAVTSFFAGAKQAVKCRRGTCRMLTLDVRSDEE